MTENTHEAANSANFAEIRADADTTDPAIHFTAIEHEAECIREALRKLPVLDEEASRAFEALGYLLTTIKSAERT